MSGELKIDSGEQVVRIVRYPETVLVMTGEEPDDGIGIG